MTIYFWKKRNSWTLLVAALLIQGCGSAQKETKTETLGENSAAGANILTDLNLLEENLERQRTLDAPLLAPDEFASAEREIHAARSVERNQGKISELKKHVEQANASLSKVRPRVDKLSQPYSEVQEARNNAIIAGAANTNEFRSADAELRKVSSEVELDKIDYAKLEKELAPVRDRYHSIEVSAIRNRYLADAYELFNLAREKGAAELVPGVFGETSASIKSTETYIEHNPYDTQENTRRATDAAFEVRRLLSLSDRARWIGAKSPEEVVLWIESRANELRGTAGLGDLRDRSLGEQFDLISAGISSMEFSNRQLSIQNEEMRSRLGREGSDQGE